MKKSDNVWWKNQSTIDEGSRHPTEESVNQRSIRIGKVRQSQVDLLTYCRQPRFQHLIWPTVSNDIRRSTIIDSQKLHTPKSKTAKLLITESETGQDIEGRTYSRQQCSSRCNILTVLKHWSYRPVSAPSTTSTGKLSAQEAKSQIRLRYRIWKLPSPSYAASLPQDGGRNVFRPKLRNKVSYYPQTFATLYWYTIASYSYTTMLTVDLRIRRLTKCLRSGPFYRNPPARGEGRGGSRGHQVQGHRVHLGFL